MKSMTTLERWMLAFLFFAIGSWAAMLGIGVVHAEILPTVRPCGFWPAAEVATLAYLASIAFSIGTVL